MLLATSALIEAIHEGFLMVDSTWHVTHCNRQAQIMLRLADPPPARLNLWDLLPDDATTPTRRELERARDQQVTVEFDVFYPTRYVWHEVRAVPTDDGVALLLRDITDRQWLLRREAERAYMRNLFDDAPVAISISRGREHQFEFVNRLARRLVGKPVMEGRTYREVFPELAMQGFIALLDHVYQSGTPYHATDQLVRLDRQGSGVLEDTYFTFTYQPLRGFDNQVSGILTLAVEVTSQVQARQAYEQLAAVQQELLRAVSDGVLVTDADGHIRVVNGAAATLHGVTVQDDQRDAEIVSSAWFTRNDGPYTQADTPLARAVRDQVVSENARWTIQRPDGTSMTVEGSARPIQLADRLVGAVVTMREAQPDAPTHAVEG